MNEYMDAMTIKLDYELPAYPKMEDGYRRAPKRESKLSEADKALEVLKANGEDAVILGEVIEGEKGVVFA